MKLFLLTIICLLISFSSPAQWIPINFPLPNEQINSLVYIDNYILAGTGNDGGIVFRTSNLGANWEVAISGLKGNTVSELFSYKENENTFIYAATDSGVFSSTNYGTTWEELSSEFPNKNIRSIYRTDDYLFASIYNTSLRGGLSKNYRSTDKGSTWNEITIEATNQSVIDFIRSGNVLLASLEATEITIYKTSDFGLTWFPTNSGNLNSTLLTSMEVLNGRIFYMTYSAMYQSTNEGDDWERIGPITWYPSELKSYGEYLFIGSLIPEMYLIHTDSTSINTLPGNSPPFQFVSALDINAGLIVAAGQDLNTSEYQIWTRTTNDITSVESTENSPDGFSLQQNFPNPFNPTTKISWQSTVGGWQSIKVFDVLGNEVATLVDEYKNAGIYEVQFDASEFTSGVYFYQITIENFKETKKMILLR